ncbi:UvrD-helicase domain-containing protein [Treponema pedis]|uniref:UvrD-helicase domain-containing protein n=1 Tax=Treponema pedis TaxID=409322 RepID=UPI0004199725|nr:UvrD-helicase domain-containing protein [Treponema pedis]
MKDIIENLLNGLNSNQINAVTVENNAVIAAGAGSGKTKVLASRYVYFIVEKNINVENIIALTFTDKASAEMHKRIYNTLKKINHQNAVKAIEKFHLARISTLDSFCNSIARLACKNFGISPNFKIDNEESKNLAYRISLDFFLAHRSDEAIRFFLGENKIDDFVKNLFTKILTEYVFISQPLDLKKHFKSQTEEYVKAEKKAVSGYYEILNLIEESDNSDNFIKDSKELLKENNYNIESVNDKNFFEVLTVIKEISSSRKGKKDGNAKEIKDTLKEIYQTFLNIYNFEYSKKYLEKLFILLEQLQAEYIIQKKQNGILTFSDVSRLAVDALIADTELRNFYKKDAQIIMIDEFQDNNSLQRDLLFLIAEKTERTEKSIPKPEELYPNKLFFVGDEKQSIYAFRGADVSVFRKLEEDIGSKEQIDSTRLLINYRTEPKLIDLFNIIFNKIFYSAENKYLKKDSNGEAKTPPYEAEYFPTQSGEAVAGINPKIELLFFDKTRLKNMEDKDIFLSAVETEAYYIAKRILEIYNSKMLVKKGRNAAPCSWNDFAILMRASSHQGVYERIFRNFGIPYKSIQQKGLFNEAPINDIYALLKLMVYPADIKTYAQVLRSPFVNVDDDTFADLLLHFKTAFDSGLIENLTEENKTAYNNGCNLFERLKQKALLMNCAELVTYIWYNEGYRYFLLSKKENVHYLELYDYLFELAHQADLKGLTLSQFVDLLSKYIENNQKLDDMEIPLEKNQSAVSFLTVHKSKGLEFPIVIIPDCGNKGKSTIKDGLVFYNEIFGIVIYPPQIHNLPFQKNMIFESLREEENNKLIAETKRLLYVAMTRAESYLIMSSADTTSEDNEEENKTSEPVTDKPRTLAEIKNIIKQTENPTRKSFFQLLLPALPDEHSDIIFKEILPQERSILNKDIKTPQSGKINFAELYKNSKVKEFKLAKNKIIAATKLAKTEFKPSEDKAYSFTVKNTELSDIQNSETSEFTAAQLGTIAHTAIEARLLNKEFIYPENTEKKIKKWIENFFTSEIYQLALNAEKIKSEYAFLTEYDGQIVSGQIDLIFKTADIVYIIDYKTDEIENPDRHKGQLSIYKKAAKDLVYEYGDLSTVKAYIFYLKTGHYFEI